MARPTASSSGPARARCARVASCSPRACTRRCVRTIGLFIVPVYDYVLVTEPLSAAQRESIGWRRRQGLSDGGNQFHYYRLTPRRPDPLGRLRRGLPVPRARARRPRRPRPDVRAPVAELLHGRSRSSPASASRTAGAARSTPAAASRSSSARRMAAAWPTPPATPGWASPPRASAPAWRSTSPTGATPRRPAPATCAASPSRSRPSRSAPRWSRLPRNRLAAAQAGATAAQALAVRRPRSPRARLRQLSARAAARGCEHNRLVA